MSRHRSIPIEQTGRANRIRPQRPSHPSQETSKLNHVNVLVIGGGGREHAICWKLRQSPLLTDLFIGPGNAGTANLGCNLPILPEDHKGVVRAAKDNRIDLVIIGPEKPLVQGLVDSLNEAGIPALGPCEKAAVLEGSKAFAKNLCERYDINHARGASFSNRTDALNYAGELSTPPVVKADGLAAGKGVFVCDSQEEVRATIQAMMDNDLLGTAGHTVVLEERLSGRELSAFSISDGRSIVHLASACDYKRIREGNDGANTGGMGSYSPPTWMSPQLNSSVSDIQKCVIQSMALEGRPYEGILFAGLMADREEPKVLEFNCRLGDPETQVILPRLRSDLLEIIWATVNTRLNEIDIEWSNEACVGVVLASGGYPGDYRTGYPIIGLESVDEDTLVFHSGTAQTESGIPVTSSGRVLSIVGTGPTLASARAKAYRNVQRIHFTGIQYRRDIAAPSEEARID